MVERLMGEQLIGMAIQAKARVEQCSDRKDQSFLEGLRMGLFIGGVPKEKLDRTLKPGGNVRLKLPSGGYITLSIPNWRLTSSIVRIEDLVGDILRGSLY